MREKYKSQTFRHGEGTDHSKAVDRLASILIDCGFEIFPSARFSVTYNMTSENGVGLMSTNDEHYKALGYHGYVHNWDIYSRKEHDLKLKTEKIFEIDGSSHEKKKQKNRDHTAEEYAEFFLPDCPVYRVPIEELIGPHQLSDAKLWILYKLR